MIEGEASASFHRHHRRGHTIPGRCPRPPIVPLPRKRLAFSATGGASPLSLLVPRCADARGRPLRLSTDPNKKCPACLSARGAWHIKSLAEFAHAGAKPIPFVFGRGVYVDENTSRPASVGLAGAGPASPARSRVQGHRESGRAASPTVQAPLLLERRLSLYMRKGLIWPASWGSGPGSRPGCRRPGSTG